LFSLLACTALIRFGVSVTLVFALIFIAFAVCLTWIDKNHQLLPDELSLSLLWIGLLANINQPFVPLSDAVIGAICGYLSLWLVTQLYWLLTQKVGMGHGDFKLFAALGAWFGWSLLPLIILSSATLGALYGFYGIIRHGKSTEVPIPFGPFLCISGTIVLLCTPKLLKHLAWLKLGLLI
jgi:leader peptidase (prepilin peptidase)/N-methyltransferase